MPNKTISIELSGNEWNVVLMVLGTGQYNTVAQLINAIREQASKQLSEPSKEN